MVLCMVYDGVKCGKVIRQGDKLVFWYIQVKQFFERSLWQLEATWF